MRKIGKKIDLIPNPSQRFYQVQKRLLHIEFYHTVYKITTVLFFIPFFIMKLLYFAR